MKGHKAIKVKRARYYHCAVKLKRPLNGSSNKMNGHSWTLSSETKFSAGSGGSKNLHTASATNKSLLGALKTESMRLQFNKRASKFARSAILMFLLAIICNFATTSIDTTSLPNSNSPASSQTQAQAEQQRQFQATTKHDEDLATASSPTSGPKQVHTPEVGGPEQTGGGTNDLFIQAALVSVKNSLAFWRPSDMGSGSDTASNDFSAQEFAWRTRINHNNKWTPPQVASNIAKKCQVGRLPANNNLKYLSSMLQFSSVTSIEPSAEILAVEGTNLKLNFVIIGHKHSALAQNNHQPQTSSAAASATTTTTASNPIRLRIHWTRNNELLPVSGPESRQSSRFSQILINENDLIRQYFSQTASMGASGASSKSMHSIADQIQFVQFHNGSSNLNLLPKSVSHSSAKSQLHQQRQSSDHGPFMLTPHLDEAQMSRIADSGSVQLDLRRLLSNLIHRGEQKTGEQVPLIDDFLAEAQSIDWQKLESYLRVNANQLGFFLPAGFSKTDSECLWELMQSVVLEQLTIVQVELSQVNLGDRGLYKLHVCQSPIDADQSAGPKSNNICQKSAFRLHIVEDVPKLDTKQASQLLEPGERLSIKCEATGFTLPQITWFLDGQQLNEHPSTNGPDNTMLNLFGDSSALAAHSLEPPSSQQQDHLADSLNRLRIGDYVSQDNHVHSFVNASQVQLSDGGFYKCQANNGYHLVEHETRIDVRGPAVISRRLTNMSSLVGANQLHIQCPYSGYPIASIEWYFRPSIPDNHADASTTMFNYQRNSRTKRMPSVALNSMISSGASFLDATSDLMSPAGSQGDGENTENNESDPDKDDWLAQASAMTPSGPEDYPEPMPDYPASMTGAKYQQQQQQTASLTSDYEHQPEVGEQDEQMMLPLDYSDMQMDLQQEDPEVNVRRRRSTDTRSSWIKYPQSRRHQVHSNGTLIIQDVNHSDQGFYKCRVLQLNSDSSSHSKQYNSMQSDTGNGVGGSSVDETLNYQVATSNEFHLTVQVPPVISPITSAESLREGMRNFLTCSVIEGDSPVRLHWLKDGQPIEEHIQRWGSAPEASQLPSSSSQQQQQHHQQQQQQLARIRVETTNEYTSTLYFSHVDFKDNGNYTCVATNKAASVNYTTRMLVNVPPKWIKTPRDLECVAGQNIVIDCQAQAHPNARVWWEIGVQSTDTQQQQQQQQSTKSQSQLLATSASKQANGLSPQMADQIANNNNKLPLQPGNLQQQPPNHYRTIVSNSRIHILENASLVIRDVSKLDQGFYLCQAANNFGSLSALIKLTVNVGASFSSKYAMKYVKLNERVELDCDPFGQAPVSVTWFMRHNSIAAGNHTGTGSAAQNSYAIHSMMGEKQLGGGGEQRIFATRQTNQSSNGGGGVEKANGILSMSNAKSPDGLGRRLFTANIRTELHNNGANYNNALGPTKNLIYQSATATTTTNDQPAIGQQFVDIDSTMSFEIIRRPHDLSEFVRLIIRQARRQHSAEFTCQAANQFGADEKLIKLLVQEPPDQVQEIRVGQLDSRSVALVWSPPYNGNSPISSYTVEWAPIAATMTTVAPSSPASKWSQLVVQQAAATIMPLKPETSYEIRVIAHNQLGRSLASSPEHVTTNEEAPNAPPADIKALPLSSSSLQLSWLPPVVQQSAQSTLTEDPSPSMNSLLPGEKPTGSAQTTTTPRSSIRGYYLGYKVANSNDTFLFKTVSLIDNGMVGGNPSTDQYLQADLITSGHNRSTIGDSNRRIRVIISDLKRSTKYSIIVQAFNSAGSGPQSDAIEAKTLVNDPPPAPQLHIGMATFTSIELQWSFASADTNLESQMLSLTESQASLQPLRLAQIGDQQQVRQGESSSKTSDISVDGYSLYYRSASPSSANAEWIERKLSPETHSIVASGHLRNDLSIVEQGQASKLSSNEQNQLGPINTGWSRNATAYKTFRYVLDQLVCGTPYQIYLIGYNSIGTGLPSQIVRSKTRGSPPIAPRRQDYIVQNSTFAQLNLETWMDGGCSINNFEIRYKQLSSRNEPANQLQWILLSSTISPDQRTIELLDLKPETWYSTLTIAESAAGKTESQFTFMTLDKFGQLPAEALDSATSNLPALFRSGGSLRSLLNNFAQSTSSGPVSPLLLSACVCLILLATCSLFMIRRYNNIVKDNASIDSRTTGGAFSSQYTGVATMMRDDNLDQLSTRGHLEHYSMKVSPCKTTTTTNSILTGGSSSNGSSSQNGNIANHNGSSMQLCNGSDNSTGICHGQYVGTCNYPGVCESPALNNNATVGKFATLTRDIIPTSMVESLTLSHQAQMNRFKTMPHNHNNGHRPVSTFLPNGTGNHSCSANNTGSNQLNSLCHNNNSQQQQQQQQLLNDYQHHQQLVDQQQQIYSKLRLFYTTNNNNYNLCPDQKNPSELLNGDMVYNTDTALNLALLAQQQQQNQKLLDCTMKRHESGLNNNQQAIYVDACNRLANGQNSIDSIKETANETLNSLLMECDPQIRQQLQDQQAFDHYRLSGQQLVGEVNHVNDVTMLGANNFANDTVNGNYVNGASSVASGSLSTSNSTQPTTSSSISNQTNISTDQLIINANKISNNQSIALTKTTSNGPSTTNQSQQQQQQSQPTNSQSQQPNEHSDYALPFPPRWV